MVLEDRVDTYQSIIDSMDNLVDSSHRPYKHINKNCITIDASHSIGYVISTGVKDPQELVLMTEYDLSNIKIMVANNELGKDRCSRGKGMYLFDLTGESGEQSVVLQITNPNPNPIKVSWILFGSR